jgi:serine/threonine protein phosphatase PrpC
MNTDCAINIGSTHSLCQDYVIARNGSADSGGPYVILSDGCSSSPDTDIGARLLVRAMEQCLKTDGATAIEELHQNAARLALGWADSIGVASQSVDATLLTAHISGESLIVACSGDGVIMLESQTGLLDLYVISSPSGYPYYPSYARQPERLSELISNGRTTKEIKHFRRELIEVTTSDSPTEVFKLNASDYKFAAVASDGIDSFFRTQQSTTGKRIEDVCLLDVLQEFWSFKNFHGAFVERRLNRFMKDAHGNGWQHADDLSIGVIYLGDNLGGGHVRPR